MNNLQTNSVQCQAVFQFYKMSYPPAFAVVMVNNPDDGVIIGWKVPCCPLCRCEHIETDPDVIGRVVAAPCGKGLYVLVEMRVLEMFNGVMFDVGEAV